MLTCHRLESYGKMIKKDKSKKEPKTQNLHNIICEYVCWTFFMINELCSRNQTNEENLTPK